jgi:hypothetical protein
LRIALATEMKDPWRNIAWVEIDNLGPDTVSQKSSGFDDSPRWVSDGAGAGDVGDRQARPE